MKSSYLDTLTTTSEDMLRKAALNEDPLHRLAVARNNNTSPEMLEALHEDSTMLVVESVAANPRTPAHILAKFAREYSFFADILVKNPSTPIEILEDYASHQDARIRTLVAVNPSTPPYIVDKLARDSSDTVRRAVMMTERYQQTLTRKYSSLMEDIDRIPREEMQGILEIIKRRVHIR